jgi:Rieske 2Fe-2S family protein
MTTGQLQATLPTSCYLSPDFHAREKEAIFCREWLAAGLVSELPEAGALRVVELSGESVLVTRTREGVLHAHYNVCRHRGARLCPAPETAAQPARPTPALAIRCGYHAWTYGLDGRLKSAPHLGELPRDGFSLHAVGIETWGGFFFLHLTPSEARGTLREQLGAAPSRLARYPLDSLAPARRIAYEVAANWKVIAENYNECYHCAPVHPELCEVVPAFKRNGGANLAWEEGIPHRDGAFTFTRSGTTDRRPFPGLSDEEKVRHKGELVYPNLFLSLSPDHVAAFRLDPLGPERTRIVCDFLFHPDELAQAGFDPEDAVEFWDLINRQDWAICEEVQRGMRSRVHRFGYYAPMEDQSLDVRRYVSERVGAPEL